MSTQHSIRDSLYLTDNPEESTFKYDDQLPGLPVPTVQESILKLLETIKPIAADEKVFKETERKALDFIQDVNVNELQELLKKRASTNKNWLEAWWLEFAYLRSRKPLIPYSNMSAPLPISKVWPLIARGQPGYEGCRAKRAALSTYFNLCFWHMLREEKMRPMIHKGVPWSMSQFKHLFNTVRQPGEPKDELITWFRTTKEGPPESTEVIVLHKGYIFAIKPVSMYGQNNVSIQSAPQIEKQLKHIEEWCSQRSAGPGVGVLTTLERTDWTEARAKLSQICDENRQLLDRIDRALSVLVLDDDEPVNTDESFRLSMCGDGSNRWADKSITTIAFKNGSFGASADHTPYDGFCTGIMTHYLITSVEECGGIWDEQMAAAKNSNWAGYVDPEPLEFRIDAQIGLLIDEARVHYESVVKTIDTLHETFQHFGKAILKEYRFHPEAFVQCAMHAAYYKQHGRMAPAYVTASTRRFHNGRTETCRSCYPEMQDFAEFLAKNDNSDPKQAYKLLKRSVNKFQQLMSEATSGHGCDRHLLGLYLIAILEGKKIPEMFDDELFQRTNNYTLSSSCNGYWNVCGGVPPLVEEGYGCFYGIEDNEITFCCTAFKPCPETDLKIFYKNLKQALLDMQKILLNSKL